MFCYNFIILKPFEKNKKATRKHIVVFKIKVQNIKLVNYA